MDCCIFETVRTENVIFVVYLYRGILNMKTKDLLDRYTATDFKEMLKTKTMLQLSDEWNCSVDTVRSAIRKLGLGKLRVDRKELAAKYSKNDLLDLYVKHQYLIHKVAEEIGCHKDTLSKLLDELEIQKVQPTAQYTPEVRARMSAQKKANPVRNLEKWMKENPEGWKQGVSTRQANNTYQRPHRENRKVLDITEEEFKFLVEFRGVLGTARHLSCSQSTVRDRALKMGIELVEGPRPAQTQTEEYKQMRRDIQLEQLATNPIYQNTSIEVALQKGLTEKGITFRTHEKVIGLTVPDIIIKDKLVVYADGCYWHGCTTCNIKKADKNNVNKNHDKFVNNGLEKAGYTVLRFWEHEINTDIQSCISKIEQAIVSSKGN